MILTMSEIKRTPLRERILPDYTRGEELMNMIRYGGEES